MHISTNLHGRLRNTSLPLSNGLLPLFEAVANAIHAIEDANLPSEDAKVSVSIVRGGQMDMSFNGDRKRPGPEAKGVITGFLIRDNGVGFTDSNMKSFLTLDSEHKAGRGGRGVGRLMWLKAFDKAIIKSIYKSDSGNFRRRAFSFDASQGVSDESVVDSDSRLQGTEVRLEGFSKRYREVAPKTAETIARDLFEHNLWYFIRQGGAPQIEIIDDDQVISLDQVFEEQMVGNATPESFDLKGETFELTHIKVSANSTRDHAVAFCASNRVVRREQIKGKIPGLYGSLSDGDKCFAYECYVSSKLLDDRVRSERTDFDIEEGVEASDLFESDELSKREIRDAVLERVSAFLSEYLEEKRRLGKERVSKFVNERAPRYRPILHRIPEGQLAVDPDITDKELDLFLHKHLAEIESELIESGHEVMAPKPEEDFVEYSARVKNYIDMADDVKKSDLANYVAHRKVILDLLESAIRRQDDGKYSRESVIHNLIMPMGKTSEEVAFDSCNLWLVDEKLAFHDFLASDKTLNSMPITGSVENKEPDLVALNVFDTPILVSDSRNLPLASIEIVELKRPMRNDAAAGESKDPVEQALGYLKRIRDGRAETNSGRRIAKSEDIPGFCYVICDITSKIEERCELLGLTPTTDYSGYFGYNQNYKAYIEVISFDRLVTSAKQRNRAFFDKLGLPAN